jgi:hypothetical protein
MSSFKKIKLITLAAVALVFSTGSLMAYSEGNPPANTNKSKSKSANNNSKSKSASSSKKSTSKQSTY